MAKGKDAVTTTTKEGEKPGATDKYPGIEGATRGEVDAFLEALDDFQPVIPDELTNHYLKSAGVSNPDARVTRLVSLAAERFVQQVADDAYRCAVQRNQAQLKEKKEKGYDLKDKRLVLECEDLAAALRDYGVSLHKPPYYVGSAPAEEEEEEEEKEEEKPSKKRSR